MKKIYGLDWSRTNEREFLTCSQDGLVKFWDFSQPRMCLATIETSAPVWRARFAPFGNYVVTMPQRKDTNLYIWNYEKLEEPVFTLSGHTDVPIEFVWRITNNECEKEYELVTLSKDQQLRLWPIDLDALEGFSGKKVKEIDVKMTPMQEHLQEDSEILFKIRELDASSPEEGFHSERILEDRWLNNTLLDWKYELYEVQKKMNSLSFEEISESHFMYFLELFFNLKLDFIWIVI